MAATVLMWCQHLLVMHACQGHWGSVKLLSCQDLQPGHGELGQQQLMLLRGEREDHWHTS